MTTINAVSKTGMAIAMAVRIIDGATPKERDLAREYEYAKWAPLYNLSHSGIENGIKALIWQVEGDHPGGHNLRNLFRKLKGKAPKKAEILEDAFSDIVNFYTIDTSRWVHFQSLDAYLKEFGSEKRYETYRYWALENKDLEDIPLFIHRELLAFLERLCQWGQVLFTSRRVESVVNNALKRETGHHANNCAICRKASVGPSLMRLSNLFLSDPKLSNRLNVAYNRNFKNGDDECADSIMRTTFEQLGKTDDPAVQYYVNRLTDLPEGSVPRPPNVQLEVDNRGVVKIRNGATLGQIQQTIDSLWCAQDISYQRKQYAKTKSDAMYALLDAYTEMVEVSVDGGPYISKRAISSMSFDWSPSCDYPHPRHKITFADDAHGLFVGQRLDVQRKRPMAASSADGIISKVSGREVIWDDTSFTLVSI